MKTLTLIFSLALIAAAATEPLATGTVTKIPNSASFMLRFKVAKTADPGLRFYPNIRFVLDNGTWIDGCLGCFPSGAAAGDESGGEIRVYNTDEIPAGRTLKHVEIIAAIGDPKHSLFGVVSGEVIPRLDDRNLKRLKTAGGFILSFPIANAEPQR